MATPYILIFPEKRKRKKKTEKKERKIKKDCFFAPGHEHVKAEPIKILLGGSAAIREWRFLSSEPVGLKGLDKELPGGFLCSLFYFFTKLNRECATGAERKELSRFYLRAYVWLEWNVVE
ncbi:MAG: hypothetical protein Q8R90_02490 [Bacteroidales bacterium]|nr:hypothetical protein [Bacteroidales bacterium]